MVSLSVMYILRTHLLENPSVVFYYKGTATENGVPFALNTIVAFEPMNAMKFDRKSAIILCKQLNLDKMKLIKIGYDKFELLRF